MFREDFVWGVAASAYQIEGREEGDGSGVGIWDTFAAAGKIADGYTAEVSCDHMHRYKEDYALMRLLGIKAYRFSLSWSRILPEGTGRVNEKAIQLYRDMMIEMRKNGIEPYITMYHWEFPQALQDRGGWLNEDVIDWFAEYARVVAESFGDLCEYFITLNEPQCFVGLGHLSGVHAPGQQLEYSKVFQIAHNALRAHGKAVIALRKYAGRPIKVGYAPTCGMAYPATNSSEDIAAAKKILFGFYNPMDNWTWNVAWFSDPVFLGKYPEEGLKKFAEYLPEITPADMELISQPLDFMGENIYNGYMIKMGADGEPEFVDRPAGFPQTAADWPVTPECFYWGIRFLHERYQHPIYITENGMSCHDTVSVDGRVHDPNRIDFLDRYLSALQKASDDGADIRGYFLWTFLDNFEWDKGYTERFGIVHVDFATRKRIVKDSALWYQSVIESNGKDLAINKAKREILYLEPVEKPMVWGSESWTISAHAHGDCKVKEGSFAGKSLSELWQEQQSLFGNPGSGEFPLLIKIIDAKEDLSIQVHPDDEYAGENENGSLGKTECWYILDCVDDASLVIGHNAADKKQLEEMMTKGKWKELLREIPVKKGDFVQIEPGAVHAIKGGIKLLETQQSSDITYRVYDYGRMPDGKPRQLHMKQALDVITVPARAAENSVVTAKDRPPNQMNQMIACDYYQVWKMEVASKAIIDQKYPFMLVSVISGEGLIEGQRIQEGDHFILPCGYGETALQGNMELILSAVPSKS